MGAPDQVTVTVTLTSNADGQAYVKAYILVFKGRNPNSSPCCSFANSPTNLAGRLAFVPWTLIGLISELAKPR